MSLVGLKNRSSKCKICTAFADDEVLNSITLDILLHRHTYAEIKEHYSPLLPDRLAKLNDVNINSHRKHSDPRLLALKSLKSAGEPITEAEIMSSLYSEQYSDVIDKHAALVKNLRQRLANLFKVQKMLDRLQALYDKLLAENPDVRTFEMKSLEVQIQRLTALLDTRLASVQEALIKEINSEKGIGEGSVHITQITQNFVNVFQTQLKGFMDDIVPYFLIQIFGNDAKRGKEVVKYLSRAMDKHLVPAFDTATKMENALKN